MEGHMGNVRVTKQNLKIVDIDLANNLIAIKGSVPGKKNTTVFIKDSVKGKK
jgi:large subunit ribosomal protein L3